MRPAVESTMCLLLGSQESTHIKSFGGFSSPHFSISQYPDFRQYTVLRGLFPHI